LEVLPHEFDDEQKAVNKVQPEGGWHQYWLLLHVAQYDWSARAEVALPLAARSAGAVAADEGAGGGGGRGAAPLTSELQPELEPQICARAEAASAERRKLKRSIVLRVGARGVGNPRGHGPREVR
jgi:hypothetical protein